MPKRTQLYRVNASTMNSLTGLNGELIVNTTRKSVHVHDGATAGGFELARADMSNASDATASAAGRMTTAHVATLAAINMPSLLTRTALTGTSTDINVPSWARKISIFLDKCIGSVVSLPIMQLKIGTLKTTGYSGYCQCPGRALISVGAYNGFLICPEASGYGTSEGRIDLTQQRNDSASDYQWHCAHVGYNTDGITPTVFGIISSSQRLKSQTQAFIDQIRFTFQDGTTSFAANAYVTCRFEM